VVLSRDALLEEEKISCAPGTYRICSPEETVARIRPVAARLGVTRVGDVTGLDVIGVPVVMVVRPASRSLSVSQGKGLTRADAVASGLMESIEAFHAEHIEAPLIWGSYAELAASRTLVPPEMLPRLSTSLYSPHTPMLWIEGGDLLAGGSAWVPLEIVTLDYTWPQPPGFGCFTMTSNGLASGNNRIEAVLHGLCEVVERDAGVAWMSRFDAEREATRIDLTTIDDPVTRSLIDTLHCSGIAVSIWDATFDIAIAVVQCYLVAEGDGSIGFAWPCYGTGCHPDRTVALRRAVLEAIQTRATFIAGSRDDIEAAGYVPRYSRPSTVYDWRANGSRSFTELPNRGGGLGELLRHVLDEIARAGLRSVVAVDLSREDVAAAVVRTIVPGLEGLRDGFPAGAEFVRTANPARQAATS
jgi:ribosomal protein S12 methylthiotransferase accessory factor